MNKNKIWIMAVVVIIMSVCLILVGCGGKSALVGKWQVVNDDDVLEFFKDGTADFAGERGTWKVEKGQLTFSEDGYSETYSYKVSGSTLTISMYGEEMILKKVKR